MARIGPRPATSSNLLVRLTYWFARKRFGRVPAPVGIAAHSGWILAASAAYELALDRARILEPRLKELASIKVATEVGCRFCIDIGSAIARGHGLREEELRDLPHYLDSMHLSSLDKRVLDYAVHMTRAPMAVPDDLFVELASRLGTPALVELTAAIAWENYRARFNHAFGAKEEGYSDGALCLLPPTPTAVPARSALT